VAISRSVRVSNNRLKQPFQPRKQILGLFAAGREGDAMANTPARGHEPDRRGQFAHSLRFWGPMIIRLIGFQNHRGHGGHGDHPLLPPSVTSVPSVVISPSFRPRIRLRAAGGFRPGHRNRGQSGRIRLPQIEGARLPLRVLTPVLFRDCPGNAFVSRTSGQMAPK